MNLDYTTDDLLLYLEGKLASEEKRRLKAALSQSRQLREELVRLDAMRRLLQETATAASEDVLEPFFTDRLMRRLTPGTVTVSLEDELASFLGRLFRPIALAGLFLSLCLAVYNVNLSSDYASDPSTAESILAMPPVSSMAVYDLDYYSAQMVAMP